ncbi:MAG TPA: hypothetical protein DIW64_16135 [Cellvibrio sp.]|nr:hypothetical protein [Cellvibrio sp.]
MKKADLVFSAIGIIGLGIGGMLIASRARASEVTPAQAGGSSGDYASGAYSDWAAQQKAPAVNAEPIGIFKTVVDGAMNLLTNPRGIRNNNPLNIEWNSVNNWVGQTGSDGRFSIFDKPENGIRAGAKILDSYAKRGINTIQKIIETWAPATENNVKAYVDHVCRIMGRSPGSVVVKMSGDYVPLIAAMIKHENGKQPYSLATIQAGVSAA